MSKDENPSAFPRTHGEHGMTLRDWFAGQCDPMAYSPFQTCEASLGRTPTIEELAEYIAAIRHIEANAMLAMRAKGGAA